MKARLEEGRGVMKAETIKLPKATAPRDMVPYRDECGTLWFCDRDLFAELVAAGKLRPGGGEQ